MAFLSRHYGKTVWNGDEIKVVETIHTDGDWQSKPFYEVYTTNKNIELKGFNSKYLYLLNKETGKTVFLHRIIYAACMGMNLGLAGLEVHHIDLDTHNNSIDNLVGMPVSEHRSYHTNLRAAERTGNEEYLNKAEKVLAKNLAIKENRLKKLETELFKELAEF